jgi:hypothetical protein
MEITVKVENKEFSTMIRRRNFQVQRLQFEPEIIVQSIHGGDLLFKLFSVEAMIFSPNC